MRNRGIDEPTVRVGGKGARRVRGGHPWVFRVDVLQAEVPAGAAVVRVEDEGGNFLGRAFWARSSRIALRLLTRKDEACDEEFFRQRIRQAIEFRRLLYPGADAWRAIHGEADRIPGLFVDRYGDALSVQTTSEGADALTPLFTRVLCEELSPRVVVAKNDTSARDFEGLPRGESILFGGPEAKTTYHEGTNRFALDLLSDLKTGAFLDQRENHVHAASFMPEGGTGLDAFSYHGGFALSLATRAKEVVAIEADETAAARIGVNARENRRPVQPIHGNSFDVLRQLEREGRRFDVVVIDPPAFAKRKGDVEAAERAYKELNLRALKLTRPGGVLISCSCSGKMTPERFAAVLDSAMHDVKRPVQLLERRGAAKDHPVLVGVPETEYLKCWIYRVL